MGVGDVQRRRAHEIRAALGPGPYRVRDLAGIGLTRSQVRSMVASGAAVVVRQGVVAIAGLAPRGGGRDEHVARIRAALAGIRSDAVVSHESAAVVHGLAIPGRPPTHVSLLVPGEANRRDGGVVVRGVSAPAEHIVDVDGLRVTDVVRTAVDVARGHTLPQALVPLDAAARRLLQDRVGDRASAVRKVAPHPASVGWVRSRLAAGHRTVWGWPGSRVLGRAVPLVDPGSESASESWWRGSLLVAGLPLPVVGFHVQGARGRWYFSDLAWPEVNLLAEVDGWSKYGERPADFRERLRRERARQHDLEAAGWRVIRWASDEAVGPVIDRLARAAPTWRLSPPAAA